MATKPEDSTTPIAANLTQDLQGMTALVQCIIRLLEDKGILTAKEVDDAAKAFDAEQNSNVP